MTDMIEQIALALWNNGKAGYEGPGAPPYVYINVWPSEYARKVWLDIVEPVRPAIEAHIAEAVAALEARVRELEGALAPFASEADARRNNLNGAVCFPQSFLIAARKALHDPRKG